MKAFFYIGGLVLILMVNINGATATRRPHDSTYSAVSHAGGGMGNVERRSYQQNPPATHNSSGEHVRLPTIPNSQSVPEASSPNHSSYSAISHAGGGMDHAGVGGRQYPEGPISSNNTPYIKPRVDEEVVYKTAPQTTSNNNTSQCNPNSQQPNAPEVSEPKKDKPKSGGCCIVM